MSASSSAAGYQPLVAESFGEFVEYAYQMYRDNPGNLQPPPPSALTANYDLVAYINAVDQFADDKVTTFYGYAARSKSLPTQIVIAIRGTQSFLEWIIDAEVLPVAFPIPNAGYVEYGFLSIIDSMTFVTPDQQQHDLASFVQTTLSGLSAPSITIAGHSLGSALATLFSALVLHNDPSINPYTTVYTFASPAVGTSAFVDFYNATVQQVYRVWNELDLVVYSLDWLYTHVNGSGHEIVPSVQQLEGYDFLSAECNHELITYLWLLKPDNPFVPDSGGCIYSPTAAAATAPSPGKQAAIADLKARRSR